MSRQTEPRSGDRVSIDEDVHELYRDLTEKSGQDPEASPFPMMKDLFMWAVAIGVKVGKPRPINKRVSVFRWDQLSQHTDIPALKALAVSETGDVDVLLDTGHILRIAEEYANAGIHELKFELIDQQGRPLWNLVNLIRKARVLP
jgi:dnd system-associated protein 4